MGLIHENGRVTYFTRIRQLTPGALNRRNIMKKPKSLNFSFVVLTLLFVLSQAAFALTASLSPEGAAKVNQEGGILIASQNTNSENSDDKNVDKNVSDNSFDSDDQRREAIELKKEFQKVAVSAAAVALMAAPAAPAATNVSKPANPQPAPKKEIKSTVKYINANELNVRKEPNSGSQLVATVKRGDKVTFYETQGEWAKIITWTDKPGYILAKYLVGSEKEVENLTVKNTVKKTTASTTSRGATGSTDKAAGAEPASDKALTLTEKIIAYAKSLQGVRYVYGGYSTKGFDCSGFVKYVFARYGIPVPRSSSEYYGFGIKVSRSNTRAGDIVLFDTDGGSSDVSHVGLYIGGGVFIHASTSRGKVVSQNLNSYPAKYMGARRVIK